MNIRKTVVLIGMMLSILSVSASVPTLGISKNGRFFVEKKSGKPVFLLCDTGWNLMALTKEEIDTYLRSRVENGFNVIMFALSFEPQAKPENAYGERLYIGEEATVLNPKALAYIDYIVEQCDKKGLYVMLYSMWGGKKAGIMNNYSGGQLYKIGKSLGAYFGGRENVIFMTGGETTPHYIEVDKVAAIGRGLKDGCGGKNLVGVHPVSEHSSSEFFADAQWLDFYMIQGKSGIKGSNYDYEKLVTKDYNHVVVKPTMLGEHRYESGVSEDAFIQRAPLYISVFAGGAAYGYGHNALWQMTPHTRLPWMLRSWTPGVEKWDQALYTEAVGQLQHIKTLLSAYPSLDRIPDQSLLLSQQGKEINHRVQVMRDGTKGNKDASYVMAYVASPQDISLNASVLKGKKMKLCRFDPRTGKTTEIKSRVRNEGVIHIPASTDGRDWVFILTSL